MDRTHWQNAQKINSRVAIVWGSPEGPYSFFFFSSSAIDRHSHLQVSTILVICRRNKQEPLLAHPSPFRHLLWPASDLSF